MKWFDFEAFEKEYILDHYSEGGIYLEMKKKNSTQNYRLHIIKLITDWDLEKYKPEPDIIINFKSPDEAFKYFIDNYKNKNYTCLVFDDLGREWFVKERSS